MNRAGPVGGSAHADRVFQVARAFTELDGQIHGPGQIAEATGLDDSTVHRILQSGVYDSIFIREGHGIYRLGAGATRLGLKAVAHAPNVGSSHPVLEDLHSSTGGGLAFFFALAPFSGARKQCLDMAVGESDLSEFSLSPRSLLQILHSLRVGAAGRSILAHLPEVIQREVLEGPLPTKAGPGAYRDDEELLASLGRVRRDGVAFDIEESVLGWVGCASPVWWDGLVMGALAVLMPEDHISYCPENLADRVRRAADSISPDGERSEVFGRFS